MQIYKKLYIHVFVCVYNFPFLVYKYCASPPNSTENENYSKTLLY